MRVAVLSTGPRPCRFLPVQKRIVASRSYGTAPESDSARSAPALLPSSSVSPPPPDVGESLREWLVSPFDIAAFGPRLTVGALLSAPEKIQNLQREISKAQEVINSPAPAEDKGKLLAAQLETYDFVTTAYVPDSGPCSLGSNVSQFEFHVWQDTNRR